MSQCKVCDSPTTTGCGNCKEVYYCSKKCQHDGWISHQFVCGKAITSDSNIQWVRGTNSSIFLSCYRENGKWVLLAKGDQFRRGFVAMSETVDGGITSLAGVNFNSISAYPPSQLNGSAVYALRAAPFDPNSTIRKLAKGEQNFVEALYAAMRLKQFYGILPETLQRLVDDITSFESFRETKENLRQYDGLTRLIEAELHVPSTNSLYYTDFQAYQDEICERFNLEKGRSLEPSANETLVEYWTSDLNKHFVSQSNGPDVFWYLIPRILYTKALLPKTKSTVLMPLATIFKNRHANVRLLLQLFQIAVDRNPPPFLLTPKDKEIISDPFPLVILSTNQNPSIRAVSKELLVPSPFEIGPTGADVVLVRGQDYKRAKKLFQELRITAELTVDDDAFLT